MDPAYVADTLRALLVGQRRGIGRALLLGGPWGCGKTFLWREMVAPELKRPILYVSAFGSESSTQLRTRIISQAILSGVYTAAAGLPGIARIGDKLKKLAPKGRGAMRSSVDAFVGTVLHRVELDPMELTTLLNPNTVICIDDIERVAPSFSIESLVGTVNVLSEHRGFDVLLICNEDQIGLGDDARDSTYRRYREKLIHAEVVLRANVPELYERILTNTVNEEESRTRIRDAKSTIVGVFRSAQLENLRALARVFSALDLYLRVAGEMSEQSVRFLAALAVEAAEGRRRTAGFYQFNDVALRISKDLSKKDVSSETRDRLEFLSRYFGEEQNYVFERPVYDLVANGFVTASAIQEARPVPPPELSPLAAALRRASQGQWTSMEDAGVSELVSELCDSLLSDPFADAATLLGGLAWARLLGAVLEIQLPQELGARVVRRLVERANRGDEALDEWSIHDESLRGHVENERQAYSDAHAAAARNRARQKIEQMLERLESAELAREIYNTGGDSLRLLLAELTAPRLLSRRARSSKDFSLLAHTAVKKMLEYRGIWPELRKNLVEIRAELLRIQADPSESKMDKWRARQTVPPPMSETEPGL